MHYVPAPLALRGFGSGFDSSRAQNPDPQRLRKGFFYTRKQAFLLRTRTRHMHYVPAPLALRGFGSGFRLVGARRLRRRIYCLARSESCASVRELRIRILSGCVRGFFTPKNGYLDSSHPPCPTAMCFLLLFPRKACAASQTCSKVLFVAYAMRREHSWRIRLAAYGARLERVLG